MKDLRKVRIPGSSWWVKQAKAHAPQGCGEKPVTIPPVCDWEIRRPVADHFEFIPCGRIGEVCTDGPEWQRGRVRCKAHKK